MRYFHFDERKDSICSDSIDRPLRVLFLTSIRDVGRRSDCNGEYIDVHGGRRYMRGLIEAVVDGIHAGDEIADHAQIVGVVYDDLERELICDTYSISLQRDSQWIYPLSRTNQPIGGEPLIDITHHIPSRFRSLPLNDSRGRAELKAEFEQVVFDIINKVRADIVVSDHLLMKIENLICPHTYDLFGRVLNIHPAITHAEHPYRLRGLTPTQDAIDRANGFIFDRFSKKRIAVSPYFKTGATLHFINKEIDDGSVICDDEPTPVFPNDRPQDLRYRNYQMAKIPVFLRGLIHYHRNKMFDCLYNDYIVTHPQNEISSSVVEA